MKKFFIKFLKGVFWLIVLLTILILVCYLYFRPANKPVWGVNFSPDQARYLQLDPIETFTAILDDLNIKRVRLVAYWENIEKEKGVYNFSETEKILEVAEKYNTKVTLVLGRKQPRWPECHQPDWYANLNEPERQTALNNFVVKTVEHFKLNPSIERWQVENEAFFNYGEKCPVLKKQDLKNEIALVKNIDNRPVVATDSGEKGDWLKAGSVADIFGTTMYRTVHNPRWGGYITYPIPPAFYRVRAGFLQLVLGRKPVIGVELQAEPWFNGNVNDIPLKQHLELMNTQKLEDNINYAWNTGLPEHYFWGAEWWYFMKKHGVDELWSIIKVLNK